MYFFLIVSSSIFSFETPQINISINEYIDQEVVYDPLSDSFSSYNQSWVDDHEVQNNYELFGKIVVENVNYFTTNATFGEMFIELNNTEKIISVNSLNSSSSVILNGDKILLYIPKINPNESYYFNYSINSSMIKPLLNLTPTFSSNKILPSEPFSITDKIETHFNFSDYQNSCIYDLELNYHILKDDDLNYEFNFSQLVSDDSGNASLIDSYNLEWLVNNGDCFNYGDSYFIEYSINSPINVPESRRYQFLNTSFSYNINSTISKMNVVDVKAKSEGVDFNLSNYFYEFTFEDNISNENITWEVASNIYTSLQNISFNFEEISLWVSKRESGLETDSNSVDNDSVSGVPLYVKYDSKGMYFNDSFNESCAIKNNLSLNSIISTNDCKWYFNYSETPAPVVWMDFNYSLNNNDFYLYNETGDEKKAQIQSHSFTTNNSDYYLREILIVIDYLLELEKNVTSIGEDTYLIEVWVKNRGNRWTPFNSPVSIFDLVPHEFEIITNLSDYDNTSIYSDSLSNVYDTQHDNFSINRADDLNGQMIKWSLGYTNNDFGYNSSLAAGHNTGWNDYNSTWYARYIVKGEGDYKSNDLYIVGLDPELVDGAGSNYLIELKSGIQSLDNNEKVFLIAFLISLGIMFLVIKQLKLFDTFKH